MAKVKREGSDEAPKKVVSGMRIISMSRDRNRAEIVIYVGEGSRRRSITRHVRRMKDGRWIGRNPDDDAGLAQLDAAEEVVFTE